MDRSDVTGEEIVRVARSFLGIPFRHAGRNRFGVDCAGFLVVTLQELGIEVVDTLDYSNRHGDPETLLRIVSANCVPAQGAPRPGDVLVMAIPPMVNPHHLAFYAGQEAGRHLPTILHACFSYEVNRGKVIESSYGSHWRGCTRSVWRVRGVV